MKRLKNKKAILAGTLVTVIAAVIILYVLLKMSGAILALINGLGEGYFLCLFKKIMSHLLGGLISPFCLPVIKTLSLNTAGDNIVTIEPSLSKAEITNIQKWYNTGTASTDSKDWRLRYKLDKEIANGMKRCKGRNGNYELESLSK